jgi:hypothetical protein
MKPEWVMAYAAIGQFLATVILALLTATYVRHNKRIADSAVLQAKAQQRVARAGLLTQIIAEYGLPEMGDAIRSGNADLPRGCWPDGALHHGRGRPTAGLHELSV